MTQREENDEKKKDGFALSFAESAAKNFNKGLLKSKTASPLTLAVLRFI